MSQLQPGDLLDNRYLLGAQIAKGGMSTVYHAVDTRLDREVAVKVMDPTLATDATFRTRFEREARAVAKLNHPTLVNVFDQGEDGAHVFLVMELVSGGSLRELLRERGPMPPHAALAVMEPVLTALSVAHSTGMIHRDIKPDNVLITSQHGVKLADFGLVRAVSTAMAGHTVTSVSTGQVIGTVGYLSPEQVQGHTLDQRSDVYSAGILLFELLTGRTPFQAESPVAQAMARINNDVPPASTYIDGVPEAIERLIQRACSRNPQQRFANGGEFLAAVRHTSQELRLPGFTVPLPRRSKVQQALQDSHFEDRVGWNDESMKTRAVPLPAASAGSDTAEDDRRHATADTSHWGDGGTPNPRINEAEGSTETAATAATALFGEGASGASPGAVHAAQPAHPNPNAYPGSPDRVGMPGQPGAPGQRAYPGSFGQPAQPDSLGQRAQRRQPSYQPPATQPTPPRQLPPPPAQVLTNRGPLRTLVWIIIIGVLLATMGIGGWWVTSGRYGEIPNVLGMDQPTAQAAVEEAGFVAELERRYSDQASIHAVFGTDPPFGQRAQLGSQVAVLVSLGRPTVPRPGAEDTTNSYFAKLAERTLSGKLGSEVYSTKVPKGGIAEVSPNIGATVNTHSMVTVHISKGPPPVRIPQVKGRSEQKARSLLSSAGLGVKEVISEFDAKLPAGKVTRTSPAEGETVPGDSDVTLYVSNAKEIPDVSGMSYAEAEDKLTGLGLRVKRGDDVSSDSVSIDQVAEQYPAAGKLFDPRNAPTVVVKVSKTAMLPFLLGKSMSSAVSTLEDMGLKVKVDGDADGIVVSQRPGFRQRVDRGDTVTLRGW